MKRLIVLLALALVVGCGQKPEPAANAPVRQEPFTVLLDYTPNADHAPMYAALQAGLYAKAGLDVKLVAPPDPSSVLRLLAAGKGDLAISYEPELMLARDKGNENLVSVAALIRAPLTTLMALPAAGIHSAADLKGKRVATAGIPYQSAYLKTILAKAGVDPSTVKETNVGFGLVPAIVSGRPTPMLGAFWNYEGVQLQRDGKKPLILRMENLGVPTYDELIMVSRRESLDAAGAGRLRRFISATAAGARLLKTEPSVGVDGLLKADKSLDRGLQEASITATLPYFFPADAKNPWGFMLDVDWANYERWMRANKLLTRPPSEAAPLTNEFLPGAGLGDSSSG